MPSKSVGEQVKECPRCGQLLFSDMDTCYGCLYKFPTGNKVGMTIPPVQPAHRDCPGGQYRQGYPDDCTTVLASPQMRPDAEPHCLGLRVQTEDVEVLVPLPSNGLLVGRGSMCDVIVRSRAVSRTHARILPQGTRALVEDCGATNGVMLNGRRVVGRAEMSVGDDLDVCGTTITLVR